MVVPAVLHQSDDRVRAEWQQEMAHLVRHDMTQKLRDLNMTRLGQMNGLRLDDWGGTYFWPKPIIPAPWWMMGRSVAYKFVKD